MKKKTTPTICLNMIVKNESRIIERCLASVYDMIDTWCIIDTGSTDGTQEIIKKYLKDKPGVLIEKPWVNFGHNRNEALELARNWGDWTLLTDADMVLVNKGFDKAQLSLEADAYDVMQDNHGTCYNNMRLMNNKKSWKCIGVTHEYYDCEGGVNARAFLDSFYFNDVSDGGSKGDKFERDIKLLTQGLIDEPDNVRYMFYLAQSYRDIRQWDKAIEWYTKRYEAGGWDEEVWFSLYMVGWCMVNREDIFEDVSPVMFKAWMLRPWRIEPMWILSIEARKKQLWHHAYQLSKIAATGEWPKQDVLFINKNAYGMGSLDEFGISSYYVGKFEESEAAAIRLLNMPDFPVQEIPRVKRNLWYARKQLGRYSEDALNNYIQEKRKEI